MIRYTYDPRRLLARPAVLNAIRQNPMAPRSQTKGGLGIEQPARTALVQGQAEGLTNLADGFAAVAQLAPPLDAFGVRSTVRTEYVGGTGWQNQRLLSLWVSLLALVLLGVGAALALRGMHKEAETMMLRGALIANVSHELRTPLSMIRLGAETLKRGKVKDKERAEIEDQILREVLLLSHLVENVLDVARIQNQSTRALAFTPVHPRDLIGNLLTTYESWIRSKGFTTSVQIDDSIGEQMWDRDSVSRALLNLIDNAIKYSADDKAIEVVLRQNAGARDHRGQGPRHRHLDAGSREDLRAVLPGAVLRHDHAPRRGSGTDARAADPRVARRQGRSRVGGRQRLDVPAAVPARARGRCRGSPGAGSAPRSVLKRNLCNG